MAVYVDDMRAPYGRWWQAPPRHDSHYDTALSKRALAVAAGAVEITWRQAGAMNTRRRVTGQLGDPATAEAWLLQRMADKRAPQKEEQAHGNPH